METKTFKMKTVMENKICNQYHECNGRKIEQQHENGKMLLNEGKVKK